MSAEQRLQDLGITLPEPQLPVGRYVQSVLVGDMLHVAGHGPRRDMGHDVVGKVGLDLTFEQGVQAARLTALNTLVIVKAQLKTLDRVVRFVKVIGRVHAAPDFTRHAEVIDGYTDLMFDVFGDAALCARAAPGMGSSPLGVAIIADALLQVVP